MRLVARLGALALVLAVATGKATAQPYTADFESVPLGTRAESVNVPGMTFVASPAGTFEVGDADGFGFTVLNGHFLFQPENPGPLEITFATPVTALALGFGNDAPAGDASLVVEFFSGGTSLGSITAPTAGDLFGEGTVKVVRPVAFNRVRLTTNPPDTLLGIDNLVAGIASGCSAPGATQIISSPSAVPSGSSFSISYTAAAQLEADGDYAVETSFDASFARILETVRTPALNALVPTRVAGADATLFVRVRAAQACGAEGPSSTPVSVRLAGIPASFVATRSELSFTGARSDGFVSVAGSSVTFRNVGGADGRLSLSQSGSILGIFFPFLDIPAGSETTLMTDVDTAALRIAGVFSGSLLASGGGGTLAIPLTLTVTPVEVAEGSRAGAKVSASTATVAFSAPAGQSPAAQTVTLRVDLTHAIGSGPAYLVPTIGPGGAWLSLGSQLAIPVPAGGGEIALTLSVDRSKRGAADGAPPLRTLLKIVPAGADLDDAAVLEVTDAEPLPTETGTNRDGAPGRRALASPPGGTSFFIPVAVKASGSAGAFFTSDGWLKNETAEPAPVSLFLTPDGANGLTDPSVRKATRTLPGGSTLRLSDLLATVFQRDAVSGQVEVRSAQPGSLSLRTTVESVTGGDPTSRYGTEIPTVAFGAGIGVGQGELVIPGIDDDATSRANLILAETSGAPATVAITVNDAAGALLGTLTRTVPPYGKTQLDRIVTQAAAGATLTGGWVGLTVTAGAGRVVPIATVIDNRSNSFSAIRGRAPRALAGAGRQPLAAALPRSLVVPAAVRLTGQFNTAFFTGLAMVNGTASPATLDLSYNYVDVDDGGRAKVARKTVVLPPRGALAKGLGADAMVSLFGVTSRSYGWMKMEGDVSKVVTVAAISARVDPDDPGKGVKTAQVDGVLADSRDVLKLLDVETRFAGAEKSVQRRTNLILVEITGAPCNVAVTVKDAAGRQVAQKTFPVAANQYFQINDVFGPAGVELGDGPFQNMAVSARVISGNGRVIALATVNDNISRNPEIFVLKGAGPPDPSIGF